MSKVKARISTTQTIKTKGRINNFTSDIYVIITFEKVLKKKTIPWEIMNYDDRPILKTMWVGHFLLYYSQCINVNFISTTIIRMLENCF